MDFLEIGSTIAVILIGFTGSVVILLGTLSLVLDEILSSILKFKQLLKSDDEK